MGYWKRSWVFSGYVQRSRKKSNPFFEGVIVRDPMFVVCCVINNNTFELRSDLTIKQGIVGDLGGKEPAAVANQTYFYIEMNSRDCR